MYYNVNCKMTFRFFFVIFKMLKFNSLGDVCNNKECRKSGWIYVFKRKHHVKVGRTSKTIIERLNQHKANGEFFDIVCFKTEYDRIYEHVILTYIRNIKYKPIDKNEYFDTKNYDEIVSIIQSIFNLSFTYITYINYYYHNKNKDRNKILKHMFDIEWMKERIKGHKVKEYEEEYEESEISSIEYSESDDVDEGYDVDESDKNQNKMQCSNCNKKFIHQIRYDNHIKSNICKQTYNCFICHKTFTTKFSQNKHYMNCRETIDLEQLLNEKIYYEKILKDKEQQYEKILKDKEIQYEKIIKDKDSTIKRLEDRCDNLSIQKNTVQYINNNNTNHTNHTNNNTIVFTDLRKLNQDFINEELANINFLNTNDPFQEICNHVNNSQLGLNYITKDKARNVILFKDENDNQSSDITKIGKMIHKSIEPKIIDVKYSDHKSSNKKYRRKIEELSNSTTDVYNKIMKECIAGAKTPEEIKIIRSSLKDKFEQITEKIKELMDSYDPEGDHHIKYGIDAVFSYVLKGIKDCIRIKNNSLFILVNDLDHNRDQGKIIEIRDTENHVQNLIYIELLRISMYISKTCKKLKKSCKDYVEIIDETIGLLKCKDETMLKSRIQNQISSIDLINFQN